MQHICWFRKLYPYSDFWHFYFALLRNISQNFVHCCGLLRNSALLLRNIECEILRNCETCRLRMIFRIIAIILLRNIAQYCTNRFRAPANSRMFSDIATGKQRRCGKYALTPEVNSWSVQSRLSRHSRRMHAHFIFAFFFSRMYEHAMISATSSRLRVCDFSWFLSCFLSFFPVTRTSLPDLVESALSRSKLTRQYYASVKLPSSILLATLTYAHSANSRVLALNLFCWMLLECRAVIAQHCEMLRAMHDCALLRWFSNTFQLRNYT